MRRRLDPRASQPDPTLHVLRRLLLPLRHLRHVRRLQREPRITVKVGKDSGRKSGPTRGQVLVREAPDDRPPHGASPHPIPDLHVLPDGVGRLPAGRRVPHGGVDAIRFGPEDSVSCR